MRLPRCRGSGRLPRTHPRTAAGTPGGQDDDRVGRTLKTILSMCRWPAACVIVAAGSASGCGRVPVEVAGRFEPAHRPAVDIRIVLQAEHRGHASRYLAAAVTALTTPTGWIGPDPHSALTLADPPWPGPAPDGMAAVF